MDSGDSDNKIILIKQEIESNEINETVDVANIKFEQEDATYGIQCDGVKVETLNLKHQDENETEMFNPEYVWVDSKQEEVWKAESEKIDAIVSDSSQPTEESGNIESNTNAETTYYPEQHRMKVELTDENWCSTAIDGDVQVKTEVKSEKLEDEAYMVPKFEQMDTLDLNEEVDIKPDGDPITTSDSDCATQQKRRGEELQVDRAESEIKLFSCCNCNYIDSSKIVLIKHIRLGKCKSKLNLSKSRSSCAYVCPHCNKMFREKTILDDHVIKKHANSIVPVSSKMHKSPQSNHTSTNENNITRRLSTHPGALSTLSRRIQGFSCCEFKALHRSNLDRHIRICKYCNASFRGQRILDNHIIKKHPEFKMSIKSKLYECSYCEFKAIHKSILDRHIRTHSTEKVITCKHCNIEFKNNRALNEHIVRGHSKFLASVSFEIYSCTHCDYKTTMQHLFDKHLLKHQAVTPKGADPQ